MSMNVDNPREKVKNPVKINQKQNEHQSRQNSVPSSKYEATQNEEMEVLRSIYMDDFEDVGSKRAWSKAIETTFKIRLFACSDKDVWLYLVVTFTPTYPATAPIIELGEAKNLRVATVQNIKKVIASKSKELIGEVMIHDIASSIQEELEHDASAKAQGEKGPSLEEERAVQEAAAAEQVREQKEEAQRRDAHQKLLADQQVQRKLNEQVKKREEAKLKHAHESSSSWENLSTELPKIEFEQTISIVSESAEELQFRAVSMLTKIGAGNVTQVYSAFPMAHSNNAGTLIVKSAKVESDVTRTRIFQLEQLLENLKSLRHANIIAVLGFKVQNYAQSWTVDILTEYANRGSLRDLLNISDYIPVKRARRLGIEILQALDFYHRNGLAHGRLHCGNILLRISRSGNMVVKLTDACFQATLYAMTSSSDTSNGLNIDEHTYWTSPESASTSTTETTKKSDLWAFGVALVEMILGVATIRKFLTPATFMNSTPLTEAFEDLLRALFRSDPRKRPNAFELAPFEFFRVDAAALESESSISSRSESFGGTEPRFKFAGPRQELGSNSVRNPNSSSRYAKEWDEVGRLGRGGFGEVVKARNKLDGRVYAIKKILQKTPAELSQVLSEVYLLATLNHPYVVRYYTAWPEEDTSSLDEDSEFSMSTRDDNLAQTDRKLLSKDFGRSTGGLDFISSSGYPRIQFGYDDHEEEEDDDDDDEDNNDNEVIFSDDSNEQAGNSLGAGKQARGVSLEQSTNLDVVRTRSSSRPSVTSTLFIQMEFCERLTLRDLIRKALQDNLDEVWRLFRQILEGLVHIHSHGIIHRDLKPENIFIDSASNVRIGDFGLAKSGQLSFSEPEGASKATEGEMTQNVGTTFYVAPELQANSKGTYTDKVDMYSLGIIFFEMCHPLKTAMERGEVLSSLRKNDYHLPPDFENADKAVQGEIIDSLLKHRPSERPTGVELLRSGKVPLQIEDETIKIAIEGLADDGSPYYHRMMSALFSKTSGRQIRAQMWDALGKDSSQTINLDFVLLQSMIRETIVSCFRRHGAIESQRQGLLPRSDYYESKNFVQLLDASGTLVQLPYDLTLPHARAVAKHSQVNGKSYAIGMVYRDSTTGGAPQSNREADFDIVSQDNKDLALAEAEIIKVVDELFDEFPPLASAPMCFHISHSELLEHIMEFCRIPLQKRPAVKEILGRLNIQQWTWQKIRLELRSSSIGVSATSLDELAQFDFRDTAEKSLTKVQSIFAGTSFMKQIHEIFTHISGLLEYCKRWGVRRPIYFSPLSSFNDKFYKGGIMFQCLFDGKKRDVVAAGGRYDSLIEDIRKNLPGSTSSPQRNATGVNIAWDRLITSMVRYQKKLVGGSAFLKKPEEVEARGGWVTRRCDVLVACFDSTVLRSTGIRLVAWLWSQDISAELAIDARSTEELLSHYREDRHSWVVLIKHEAAVNTKADLKIKSLDKKEDFDIRSSDLVSFLRGEIRERDQREGTGDRHHGQRHHNNATDQSMSLYNARKPQVQVLTAAHKSKKSNKFRVIEAAQAASQELLQSFGEGPVASIETRDEIMDMIRETRLSDAESWKRVVQKVPLSERNYVQEVQQLLQDFKAECIPQTGGASFIFNFRTGKCIFYDLLA